MRPRLRQKKKKNGVQRHQPTEQTFVKKWFKALTDTKSRYFNKNSKFFLHDYRTYTQIEKVTKCFNKIKRNLKKIKHPKLRKAKFPILEIVIN